MPVSFQPLTGGRGALLLAANPGPDLGLAGYTETEYLAAGTAARYRAAALPTDGRFEFEIADDTADFATRVIVRMPTGHFNGTLVVEWLNVSSGQDASPGYSYLAPELLRGAYAWAGVSAQYAGVEGGIPTVALAAPDQLLPGLAAIDADRYVALHHPGDAYCYDMFTQIARGLAAAVKSQRTLAIGESQSAITLSTYINGVQPLTRTFDGFIVHSRGGAVASLGEPGAALALRDDLSGPPTIIRPDCDVPVIVVETETDLFGFLAYKPARQPDSPRFRLWEIAGAAHADKYLIGRLEAMLGCPSPINRGQQAFVLRAALRALDTWTAGGAPPPSAQLLGTSGTDFVPDADGNTVGGVRTPAVDVPVSVLSGRSAAGSSPMCELFGSTTELDVVRLRTLYSSRSDYLAKYAAAADAAIAAGFVLADDRTELLAAAEPDAITW